MTETAPGTNGGVRGTSGGGDFTLFAILGGLTLVFALVNATSGVMESIRDGGVMPAWHYFLFEFSSVAVLMALTPVLVWCQRRWPFGPPWVRTVPIHVALTVPFSLVHVGAMVAIRELVWTAVYRGSADYNFLHDTPGLVLVYEWRKDVLSYFLISGVIWGWDRLRRPPAPVTAADCPLQIEIRQGARTTFLPAADVYWLEAAGNYVEVHDARQTHLVRGTLASFEAQFPAILIRVHRSRLVNRARIRGLSATDAGDFTVTFDDGRTIGGSRRYRAGLDTKMPAGPPSGPAA